MISGHVLARLRLQADGVAPDGWLRSELRPDQVPRLKAKLLGTALRHLELRGLVRRVRDGRKWEREVRP